MGRAHGLGVYQPDIAQYPEMMRHGGLGAATVQLAAACLTYCGKAPDNLQTNRIAQGVKQTLKNELANGGMFERAHG